jgi:riboflavin biosynthesis pyrimidine reductase
MAPEPDRDVVLSTLFERPGLPAFDLPEELRRRYDGPIGFASPVVYANFVSTLDGVVAMGADVPPSIISGKSPADRFVMGLLRACADAVVVGAGTLRAEPKHLWTPERIDPGRTPAHRELRARLGRDPDGPALYLLTESGAVDPGLPAFQRGATVITTVLGASRLEGRLPSASRAVAVRSETVTTLAALDLVRADGHGVILTEGGPTILGQFVRAALVDELFLTLSPRVAGHGPGALRLGFVEGFAFEADRLPAADLLSVRRHGSHLFLRYAFTP